jgi:endo-1,4-beta-mannosidase
MLVALVGGQRTAAQPPIVSPPISPVIIHGGRSFITAADWQPFEVRGVNYIRPSSADPKLCPELHFGVHEACPWDSQAIAADMDRLQALGVNTVRVFLNFYAFGGTTITHGSYSIEPSLQHLAEFITIANSRNIYVMPVLMAKYPQESHFDAEMFSLVVKYHVQPIVQRFANHPGILAWDLFNEPDIAGPVDVRCWDWDNRDYVLCFGIVVKRMLFLNMLRDEVKRLDLYKPLTISVAFAKSYFRPQGAYTVPLADLVDFYAVHYYDNDPYDSGRYAQHWYYGQGFPLDFERSIDELHALNRGKPIVITEVGFPSGEGAMRTLEESHRDLASVVRISRERGVSGVIIWPFLDVPEQVVGGSFR